MGARGPDRKPTALRVLHGQSVPADEVQPRSETPDPPEWLTNEAREVWDRTVPELEHMRVLTSVDGEALAMYCTAVALHAEAVETVDREGLVVTGAMGAQIKHPLMQVIRDQATMAMTYARAFGMTPASRVGLTTGKKPDDGKSAERLLS